MCLNTLWNKAIKCSKYQRIVVTWFGQWIYFPGFSLQRTLIFIILVIVFRAWQFISLNFRKKGSLLVTVPSIQEALAVLQENVVRSFTVINLIHITWHVSVKFLTFIMSFSVPGDVTARPVDRGSTTWLHCLHKKWYRCRFSQTNSSLRGTVTLRTDRLKQWTHWIWITSMRPH